MVSPCPLCQLVGRRSVVDEDVRRGTWVRARVPVGGTTVPSVGDSASRLPIWSVLMARLPTWWLVLPRLPAWWVLRWHDSPVGGWSCHDCLLGGHFGGTTTHLVGGTRAGQRASRVRSGRDLRIRKASEWVPVSGLHVMGSCGTSLPQLPIRWLVLPRLSTRSALRWHDHLLGRSSIGTAAYRAVRRPAPLPPQGCARRDRPLVGASTDRGRCLLS